VIRASKALTRSKLQPTLYGRARGAISLERQSERCRAIAEDTFREHAQQSAAREQLARYEALGNGEDSALVFSASEVEELVGWFHKRIYDGGLPAKKKSLSTSTDSFTPRRL